MSKALCIKKSDLFPSISEGTEELYLDDPQRLFKLTMTLEDRSSCETDESLLQVIPYITLIDRESGELFIYRRGQASGEQRLSGKCSIGLGGHMEMIPSEHLNMMEIIAVEAARELEEEVGIPATAELMMEIKDKLLTSNCGVMYCLRTPVDRVHLAVAFFVFVDKSDLRHHEKGVITRGQWMSIRQISSCVQTEQFEVEQWTKMVLHAAKGMLNH